MGGLFFKKQEVSTSPNIESNIDNDKKITTLKSRRKVFIEELSKTKNFLTVENINEDKSNNEEEDLRFKCRCDPENCKFEDWRLIQAPYIVGLNSSKIGNNLIASQRPSSCLVKDFKLIEQFKQYNKI